MLLFNGDVYRYLGNYKDRNGDNMATRIQKAWCSAVGLAHEDYATLAEFLPMLFIGLADSTPWIVAQPTGVS